MRIGKLYSPWDTEFFGPSMAKKYRFEIYVPHRDKREPTVFFGCYGKGTKVDIMHHKSLAVIVWSGSDSTRLHEVGEFVDFLRSNTHRVFHIAHSHWIQKDLEHFGIPYSDRVVLPVEMSGYKFEEQQGTKVYHYGSKLRDWYYGTHLMKDLAKRWNKSNKYPDIFITIHGVYKKPELYEIYKDSFIGVRLTEHDNMALSCIEMGLMGRYSIFNGNIPCAIPYSKVEYSYNPMHRKRWVWQDDSIIEDVGRLILHYRNTAPSRVLADRMREFVYDDEDWLNTEYYE